MTRGQYVRTKEIREKIGNSHKGKKLSEEHKRKIKENAPRGEQHANYIKDRAKLREKKLIYAKKYRESHKEEYKKKMAKYFKKHKVELREKARIRHYKRLLIDPAYKISLSIRARLGNFLKFWGIHKDNQTFNYVGCSKEELKIYIESKFIKGMSWDNYGRTGWHIDHIKPLCSFDLMKEEELHKACHYTNLQPLWAKDNLMKSGKH